MTFGSQINFQLTELSVGNINIQPLADIARSHMWVGPRNLIWDLVLILDFGSVGIMDQVFFFILSRDPLGW